MSAPIALQLYSIREPLSRDFEASVREIARMGYVGVEPAGFPGTPPEAAGQLFEELGLAVPGAHTQLPLGEYKNEVIDAMKAIGCQRIISGKGPDDFATMDLIKRTCDIFNEASAVAAQHGMLFGIHNHWWEFEQIDGRYVFEVMLDLLEPDIFFEVDTYWVQSAGADPANVVKQLGQRAPFLHIKDGPCTRNEPMTAVGDGVMDIAGIVSAAGGITQWMIVELDRCATDMMEAVERSYTYLTENGLAAGRSG
ncbi:MAG: sugar phosphate isomerase/epimerase [Chloroflexi bacterium]|nr:sugar phosphate isomerase/epimerase [Chloroflexota bacterium]